MTHILSSSTDAPAGADFSNPEELSPKTYGNLQLNYQQNKWNGNLSVVAHDGIPVSQSSDTVAVFNTKITYRANRHWNLGFNVRNLLNKDYSTPQSRVIGQDSLNNDIQQLPSREREIFLTLQFNKDA